MSISTSTIVFTDIVGSTVLRARLGEETADALFREHERALASEVVAGDGRVVKSAGDGMLAAFDSATHAVRAAVVMQQRLALEFPDLRMRIGIAAGDVSWEDGDCFGMPVVTAARLQARADGGQIVVSGLVRLLAGERSGAVFRSLGALDLVGLNEPVDAYDVSWDPVDAGATGDGYVVPLPPALSVVPTFSFVGRDAEWAAMVAAWEASTAGARRVVLVGGEAGTGKTRLAFEFARWCAHRGAAVVLGVCDAELALPYQPWVQILDQLVRAMPPEVRSAMADELADVAILLPHLERLVPGLRRPQPADAQTERHRLFHAVAAIVAAVARKRAVVVLVDDLQWGDAQTLALLRHVARADEPAELLVIGTFRDTSDEVTEPLASCLADLRRAGAVERLRLTGLDRPSIGRFVTAAVGHGLDDGLRRVTDLLAERSTGNAFYVSELWRHLVARGSIVQVDGRWTASAIDGDLGVPDGVREVVGDRIARLSEPARRVLDLAAVAGLRVPHRVLSVAVGSSDDERDAALDELVRARLLVETTTLGTTAYEFGHAIVRETVESTGLPAARARLHRRLGEAIEQAYGADLEPVLADLARHFVSAARLGQELKAVDYSRRAAAQAMRSGAHDAAVAHLEAARALAASGPVEIDITLDLGEVSNRAGDNHRAGAEYDAAFRTACRAGDTERAVRAALGFGETHALSGLQGRSSVDITRAALALVGEVDTPGRTRLLASFARALSLLGREDEGEPIADQAIAAARRHGDEELVLYALRCKLHMIASDPRSLASIAREACGLAKRLGDGWAYCYSMNVYVRCMLVCGQVADAVVESRELGAIARSERVAVFSYYAACHDVLFALIAGRFGDAERLASDAHQLGGTVTEAAAGVFGVHMFAVRREQGRLREVAPLLTMALRSGSGEPVWRPGLAVLLVEVGMLDEARLEFAALSAESFASVPRDSMWPCCLAFLAEVCVGLADVDRASALYGELQKYEGLTLTAAFTVCLGPADRLMGSLAALLGRRVDAEGHFRAALELAERSGSPVWIARVQHAWAAALGDRDDLLASAHATAVALGMADLAERTRPRTHLRAVPDPELPAGLTVREAEVLELVATGKSNREIGELLFISGNTVANHIRAILQKTGCTNRAEAAAYAARLERGTARAVPPSSQP